MKKVYIFFVLVIPLLIGAFSNTSPVSAATRNTSADTYTIRYLDKNGHDERIWRGTTAEAQKIIKVEDARRSAALATAFKNDLLADKIKENNTQTSANPFLNRVDNCTWPNNFLVFWNSGPLVCFANSGVQSVIIYEVYRVDSGNNAGQFRANEGPTSTNGGAGWVNLKNPIRFGQNQTLYPAQNDAFIITSIIVN